MSKFSGKNVLKITGFDLKSTRKSIFGWIVTIFSIMFLYMILFNSIQEMGSVEMEIMPEQLLQFMGMENLSDMSAFTTYFGMIYALIIIAISVFGASFTAGLLYKEEKDCTIEFLYSLEVSRTEIYISKALTGLIATILVIFSAIISTIICGGINGGETFKIADIFKIGIFSGFIPVVFWGIALLLVGLTARIRVTMAASMVVFITYLLGYLSALLGEKAPWLAYISPFEMFKPKAMLHMGTTEFLSFLVYFVVIIASVVGGRWFYSRRDFNV